MPHNNGYDTILYDCVFLYHLKKRYLNKIIIIMSFCLHQSKTKLRNKWTKNAAEVNYCLNFYHLKLFIFKYRAKTFDVSNLCKLSEKYNYV